MFKKPFSFEGRIRRTEYGLSYIMYMVALGIMAMIIETNEALSVIALGYIPAIWFLFAQGAKRCHDTGRSGWFQIIPFFVFWMLFENSAVGENKFGQNPKGIGNFDEIDEIGKELVG